MVHMPLNFIIVLPGKIARLFGQRFVFITTSLYFFGHFNQVGIYPILEIQRYIGFFPFGEEKEGPFCREQKIINKKLKKFPRISY